jgi:hypothetical protein
MTLWSLCRFTAMLVSVASAAFILPAQAQARPEVLRWTHSETQNVSFFELHVRAPDGSASQVIPLTGLAPDGNGIFQTPVEVGSGDKLISIRAVSLAGAISAWSTPPQLRTDSSARGGGGVVVGPGTPITPTPGATARYDFTSNAVGSRVTGWIDTRAGFSLRRINRLFSVTRIGSNNVIHTDSTADNIHSHLTGSDRIWSDYELRGRMVIDDSAATIGVTTYSQYPRSDAYYRLGRGPGEAFTLQGRPSALSCSNDSAPVTPQPGVWVRFKFDVQGMGTNNQVRAKVWRENQPEPTAYSLNCVDSSAQRPRSGRVGIWSGDAGKKYWDDLEVIEGDGSGGSPGGGSNPPPPPILIQIIPVAR